MPSFSQHNLRLVVSGCSLHVSLTKFEDKFASLRQVNSPNNWNKFQICTDMYLIRFLPNFAVFCEFMWISRDFPDLPEFPGFATARNIRSPVWTVSNLFFCAVFIAWQWKRLKPGRTFPALSPVLENVCRFLRPDRPLLGPVSRRSR